jgi:hypothetical protein
LLNGVPVSSQFSKPLVEGRRTSIFNSPVLVYSDNYFFRLTPIKSFG